MGSVRAVTGLPTACQAHCIHEAYCGSLGRMPCAIRPNRLEVSWEPLPSAGIVRTLNRGSTGVNICVT